jgi:hypothetical protein
MKMVYCKCEICSHNSCVEYEAEEEIDEWVVTNARNRRALCAKV